MQKRILRMLVTYGGAIATFYPGSVCLADIAPHPNGNGSVGVENVLAVIAAFEAPCNACAAEVAPPAGDSQVTIADIIYVIVRWGNCS